MYLSTANQVTNAHTLNTAESQFLIYQAEVSRRYLTFPIYSEILNAYPIPIILTGMHNSHISEL